MIRRSKLAREFGGRMYLNKEKSCILSELFSLMAEDYDEAEVRMRVGEGLLRLLDADQFASFVWRDRERRFGSRVAINMSDDNLGAYERYFQFRDPITPKLQVRRVPTLVTQVMPQAELMRTEFFNDFLRRDGLHHGVNLYAWEGDDNIGDLRIWRSRRRDSFDTQTLDLLRLVQPAFTAALRRCRHRSPPAALTGRSAEIAACIAQGLSDKEIAARLGIEFSTVRTHVDKLFRRYAVTSRTQLVSRLYEQREQAK